MYDPDPVGNSGVMCQCAPPRATPLCPAECAVDITIAAPRTAAYNRETRTQSICGYRFCRASHLFDVSNFLLEGVGAWFAHDHMKAIHVLVPQVECALRTIAGKLGEPVTRKHPIMPDLEIAIGMGEIFGNKAVTNIFGADLTLYFKLIYSDPRGLNLRNSISRDTLERGNDQRSPHPLSACTWLVGTTSESPEEEGGWRLRENQPTLTVVRYRRNSITNGRRLSPRSFPEPAILLSTSLLPVHYRS